MTRISGERSVDAAMISEHEEIYSLPRNYDVNIGDKVE